MPEIAGTMTIDGDGPKAPCLWCGEATDTRAKAPGLVNAPMVPLHVFCAGSIVAAYGRARSGQLDPALGGMLDDYRRKLALIGSEATAHDAIALRIRMAIAADRSRILAAVDALEGECHDGEGLGCETHPCVENVSRVAVRCAVQDVPYRADR